MRRLKAIIRKELLQIRRDPRTLGIILVAPVLMLLLYGYAVNFDIRNIPLVICDQDHSTVSREVIGKLFTSDYFTSLRYLDDPDQMDTYLVSGQARVGIWIQKGFGNRIARGQTGSIFAAVDGADGNTANIAMGYLNAAVQSESMNIMVERLSRTGKVNSGGLTSIGVEQRIWYNPELKSNHYIVPGLIAVLLMMMTALLTSMAITGEIERNTIEQLVASPIRPVELIAGKMLPYVGLSLIGVALDIPAGIWIFGVPFRGDLGTLAVFTVLFLVACLGIGLMISTVAKNQQTAMFMALLLTMLPSILLSGFVFPIAAMPEFIQWLSYLVPARYFLLALRGIFLKGVGLDVLWPQALAMTAFGLLLITVASRRFHKRLG